MGGDDRSHTNYMIFSHTSEKTRMGQWIVPTLDFIFFKGEVLYIYIHPASSEYILNSVLETKAALAKICEFNIDTTFCDYSLWLRQVRMMK